MQAKSFLCLTGSRPAEWRLFLLGGLLGALAFLLVFGVSPLDVTNDAFCRGGYIEKDIQQHYAGWLLYRQSPLRFPLCVTESINRPDGSSVAYTDSIPLFAAFFRLLEPLLPQTFQYFGLFTLLCFFLQGGFGAILLRLFASGWALPLLGDLVFVFSPVLWERALRHTSLAAQFLILGALYYYVKGRREPHAPCTGLFILNVLAITIHPYFVPMTYAVTLALVMERCRLTRRPVAAFGFLALDLAATAAAGWALGLFFGAAGDGSGSLYGYFSMNLNSLWNPAGVNGVNWSLFLPAQNQVAGNYDAFAYLGLGVIAAGLACMVGVCLRRLHPLRLARRHLPLCIICLLLTLFAVSHTITANGATLAVLPLPAPLLRLCSVFRSGGRMFWPVYYLLMLLAFVGLSRLTGRRGLRLALAGALAAVQLLDLSPGLSQRHAALLAAQQQPAFPSALTSNFWQQAAGRYAHIVSMDSLQDNSLCLALYAADNGMTTNDPFAARYEGETLAARQAELLDELGAGVLRDDTLYLFASEGNFLQAVESVKESGAWCGRIETAGCCWYVIAPGMAQADLDEDCTPYDENYPLRLADYTDALWNRGVLDSDRRIVCFVDSPFARAKLENACALCAQGQTYAILDVDDSDPGWLMVALDIQDATVLWGQELETIPCEN